MLVNNYTQIFCMANYLAPFQKSWIHPWHARSCDDYLVVTIQHDLRWSEAIHNITVKANCTLSFLRRNLKLNNQYLKEQHSMTTARIRLCSLVTVAKNRDTKFRENQSSSCKICHKYLPSHQQYIQHDWPTRMARLWNSKTKFPTIFTIQNNSRPNLHWYNFAYHHNIIQHSN